VAEIQIWGGLRPAVGGASTITLEAATIRELFRKLEERYPKTLPYIEQGISVSIDGVIYRDSWEKKLPKGAEIYLLPRIEGG
jgi:molybdopterin converting factor small subunit